MRAKPAVARGAAPRTGSSSKLPSSEEPTLDEGSAPSTGLQVAASGSEIISGLTLGAIVAGRYLIERVLGKGGMGMVYQAKDRELDRIVALKTIRPELAGNPSVIQRFKQELILARQVTHRNAVRIYDLGEAEGLKFITMEYVDGEPLTEVMLRYGGKLPPKEAAEIIEKVCLALEAAHAEGVVHRDLKPGNIMQDRQGRIVVMDFGLAHSVTLGMAPNALETLDAYAGTDAKSWSIPGSLRGTPRYMSPEQARREEVDARSDLYSVGLILYELVTGQTPFESENPVEALLKRTKENPRPLVEVDPQVPRALSNIAAKCLERDREARYQTVGEVLADLEKWRNPRRTLLAWAAASFAILLLAGVQFFVQRKPTTGVQHAPVSVLVGDFKNDTGDPVFDGTLEPAFSVAMEGASFVTTFNRGQARKLATQLQPGSNVLDEQLARLIATREGINTVISGSISGNSDSYQITVRALDGVTGKAIVTASDRADKKNVLVAMGKLAAKIRKALGDKTPESVQLAAAETFTTGSVEAAHEYGLGQDALWAGKYEDAIRHYQKSLESDPDLGRAYSGLAVASVILGRNRDGMNYYKLALSKIDRMSEREKYRTRGTYYVVTRDTDKAIEELTQLVRLYPSDTSGFANLALAYFYRRDMVNALQQGRRAVEISPGNVLQRNNIGLYAMYAGDFDTAVREQQKVLELNPSLAKGFLGIALSRAAQGQIAAAYETYRKLEKQGTGGASMASTGEGDLALYEGRAADAVKVLEKGISADLDNKDRDNAAIKLTMVANAALLSGKARDALIAVEKALANSTDNDVLFFGGRVYLAAGLESKALALARQLEGRTDTDAQAYGRLIEGEAQLPHGKPLEALRLFKEAQKLADAWLVRFDLGRGYVEAGQFPQADSEFELCLKRKGEATAAFLDEVPTIRLLPEVYYYLGRAQEGLKSPAAAESYKTFLAIRQAGRPDPLVTDARRRVGLL